MDHWFAYIRGCGDADEVFQAVATELPTISSLILDRSCRFQCQHCIFQEERSRGSLPSIDAVLHVLKQLPHPKVVHEGRQLTPKQLPLLEAICRAGYPIGIIESGTYVAHVEEIIRSEVRFDWIDISIDGPEEIHNLQRNSERSWETAINGLKYSGKILKSHGKVTSLTTLTALNYAHVSETGGEVFEHSVNEWHLTTLSVRDGIEKMKASEKQLEIALDQLIDFCDNDHKIFLRIYDFEDMRALASIFGEKSFSKTLKEARVTQNAIVADIGFPLHFYPLSLGPSETLVIDVDSWWRLPYCIKYTIEELHRGTDSQGRDISAYNVAEIRGDTQVLNTYRRAASHWREYAGERQLEKERLLFQNFL